MKIKKGTWTRFLLWSLVLLMAIPPGGIMAQAQDSGGQQFFRQEELDQILAPIALYPDELLVEVLMAATYPLEVVQAARWVQANPNLKGDQFAMALEQQDWDPSVKSVVNFPSVLQMMNERLDWTQKVGDAFLAQHDQIMDTVQNLRQRAQAQGNLKTTSQQRVIVEPQAQTIAIEPAAPQVVYVPMYDPMVVYGPWWWPAYPPYYFFPRGPAVVGTTLIGFGIGVALGVAWGYAWGGFNWRSHQVVVNVTRNVYLNNRIDRARYAGRVTAGGGQGAWTHDPGHRRGVAYRAPSVAERYGRGPGPGADVRRDFRGFDRTGPGAGRVAQGPVRPGIQQPQAPGGPTKARPETARVPSGPVQQPRVATGPEPAKLPSGTVQQPQPRVATGSEPARQPSTPAQQPRVVTGPEPARQPSGPVQQPRMTTGSPVPGPAATGQPGSGREGVQGIRGPTAFGGITPGTQTRQFSNRGTQSMSGGRTQGPAPSTGGVSRSGGGGGQAVGTAPRSGGGGGQAPQGGGASGKGGSHGGGDHR